MDRQMKKTVFLLGLLLTGNVQAIVEFNDCRIKGGDGVSQLNGECAQFLVPEDREVDGARDITLHLVRLKARARDSQPDPVFFIAGGPGQSATDFSAWQDSSGRNTRQEHKADSRRDRRQPPHPNLGA